MSQEKFRNQVIYVVAFYLLVIVIYRLIMLVMDFKSTTTENRWSIVGRVFRDLIPLIINMPAAWLAYCFQRRQSYLSDVRNLYTKLVVSVQEAIQYTNLDCPSQERFVSVKMSISTIIDEMRGVFINVGESDKETGLYPFESLKDMFTIIDQLGYGSQVTQESAISAHSELVFKRKEVDRTHFLLECPRGHPIQPDSPFLE